MKNLIITHSHLKGQKKIGIDSKLSINGQEKIMIIHVLDWKI